MSFRERVLDEESRVSRSNCRRFDDVEKPESGPRFLVRAHLLEFFVTVVHSSLDAMLVFRVWGFPLAMLGDPLCPSTP